MNNKILLTFILGIFFLTFVSANLGTFSQYECVDLQVPLNTTNVTIATINYPDGSLAMKNLQMQNIAGKTWNYTFCQTNYSGCYNYNFFDNEGEPYGNNFCITPNGEDATIGKAVFYIGLLVVLLFFLAICVFSFVEFDNLLNRVGMIGLSYLFLTAITFIGWNMASDFITSAPFLISMLRILFFVFIISALPLFMGAITWYFLMLWKIKEIESLMTKGYSYDDAENRVKRRRK